MSKHEKKTKLYKDLRVFLLDWTFYLYIQEIEDLCTDMAIVTSLIYLLECSLMSTKEKNLQMCISPKWTNCFCKFRMAIIFPGLSTLYSYVSWLVCFSVESQYVTLAETLRLTRLYISNLIRCCSAHLHSFFRARGRAEQGFVSEVVCVCLTTH